MSQVYKKKKKLYEKERRKLLVTLWLVNVTDVTNHNVTQMLKKVSCILILVTQKLQRSHIMRILGNILITFIYICE
ncbi:hypothetical protein MTR_3g064540 [Medicago truncatula]|uniref:Uncharacterized protein n=1 Tax=Medicago truncatula TaxID=3880 RepID=G7J7Z3_MEDTR|nr:hypothetical protein MTR_3g064540 [Medicago truncatula]